MTNAGEGTIIVRRTGDMLLYLARYLLVAFVVLTFIAKYYRSEAGMGRPVNLGVYLAVSFFLCAAVGFLFWKALPRNTVFDTNNRMMRITPNDWGEELLSFDEIEGIRPVSRRGSIGYCLVSKTDPLFDCRMITDWLGEENAYAREFSLQILPRIKDLLPASPPVRIRPADGQTCFARDGDKLERRTQAFLDLKAAELIVSGLFYLFSIAFFSYLVRMWNTGIGSVLSSCFFLLLLWAVCFILFRSRPDPALSIWHPDRKHILDPAKRTIEILYGLFSLESKTFSFDDLEAVCICVKTDLKTKKSVYFRFKGDKHLHLVAHDTPDKLREILASYALVMDMDLSGKIEYVA